ncbi:uncharacterized protein LOC131246386 [Magnolia sinica]|uniref:uncharacterized protein LOC131246386 n=1 Tax=Magnolia sinica TaxID=86752 RepID=UPI00265AB93E|nr:uncharacterized protein LOC131246386 [Magnolia sinica]
MLEIPKGVAEWELTVELQKEPAFCLQIDEAETPSNDQPWYTDIKEYLEHQKYPEGVTPTDRRTIQQLVAWLVIIGGILYKRSFNQVLLRCVNETKATQIMSEIHKGLYGPHMNGHMMAKKILRLDYYWLTMEIDCCEHVRKCFKCQEHVNQIHAPASKLYNLMVQLYTSSYTEWKRYYRSKSKSHHFRYYWKAKSRKASGNKQDTINCI